MKTITTIYEIIIALFCVLIIISLGSWVAEHIHPKALQLISFFVIACGFIISLVAFFKITNQKSHRANSGL